MLFDGSAAIDDVLDDYIAFKRDRIERGLVVDRTICPYSAERLEDRKFVKASMITNPFEKFERNRFMCYAEDLGLISINHALQARLSEADYAAIREQIDAGVLCEVGKQGLRRAAAVRTEALSRSCLCY